MIKTDRYKVKCIDGLHYVIDTKKNDTIVSSGYYNEESVKTVCDKKNVISDLSGYINIKL
ncbi:MAG: hypothetical protein K0R54_2762 [Clostridiaceae bacterium]|nr:hypothetical protein [Clostridiaceae bacterium]MDF2950480.1 hypothetical protein [Anaerocolumna sp.]